MVPKLMDDKDYLTQVGKKVRAARKEKGLSSLSFLQETGVAEDDLKEIETGTPNSEESLSRSLDYLGLTDEVFAHINNEAWAAFAKNRVLNPTSPPISLDDAVRRIDQKEQADPA